MSNVVPISITDLRSDIPAVIKHDDDTKRTVPLCEEEEDTDHFADPSHKNINGNDALVADNDDDDEDSEISSLGGLEDGFDVQATLDSFDEAAASHTIVRGGDDDVEDELSTGVPRRIVADHALSPRVSPIAVPPTPSFNEFLKQRQSTLGKNVDYLCNASQRSSFAEERLELFSRNVHFLLGKTKEETELEEGMSKERQLEEEEEEEPSFLEARWSTFSRNLQFISSQLNGENSN
jgi:hypothetical protein